jgi:hypothetical protein
MVVIGAYDYDLCGGVARYMNDTLTACLLSVCIVRSIVTVIMHAGGCNASRVRVQHFYSVLRVAGI